MFKRQRIEQSFLNVAAFGILYMATIGYRFLPVRRAQDRLRQAHLPEELARSYGFEDDLFFVIHLMITGRFRWRKRGTKPPGKRGLAAFTFGFALGLAFLGGRPLGQAALGDRDLDVVCGGDRAAGDDDVACAKKLHELAC